MQGRGRCFSAACPDVGRPGEHRQPVLQGAKLHRRVHVRECDVLPCPVSALTSRAWSMIVPSFVGASLSQSSSSTSMVTCGWVGSWVGWRTVTLYAVTSLTAAQARPARHLAQPPPRTAVTGGQ
jgi:hypothetical protein